MLAMKPIHRHTFGLFNFLKNIKGILSPYRLYPMIHSLIGAPVTQSIERSIESWTCDWKVAGLNPGLKGPCETISIVSALCTVLVFQRRHKTETPSQSTDGVGLLN